jgi:two-component system nitrate/nitrite sensor histidine kinase NarX
VAPLTDATGRLIGASAIARDITERKRAEQELAARACHQAAMADLRQWALASTDASILMDGAVALVARTLDAEYAAVLEPLPDGAGLRLRAGVGWTEGLIGQGTVGLDSPAGYVLASGEPVLVADLRTETRFGGSGGPALLRAQGIVSGVSILMGHKERPAGVLEAHTTRHRLFTADEVYFLRAVANLLTTVSVRTVAEEALRVSERRYRAIFEQSPSGLILYAPTGLLLDANRAVLGTLPREQVTGYNVLADQRFIAAGMMEDIQRAFSGEAVRLPPLSTDPPRGSGTDEEQQRWVRAFLYPVMDEAGAVREMVATVEDITEQKVAEDQLREKEAQYRAIFEASSDGLIITDMDDVIIEMNPAFCSMHGYTREELIGRQPTAFIHPDYHHGFADFLRTISGGGFVQTQGVNLRKDGTQLHVEVHASAFTYRGRPHILRVVRDVTARVEAYELLEQRVAERTQELSTLLEVSSHVAATLELQPLLALILDQLKMVVDYTAATIFIVEGANLVPLEHRGPLSRDQVAGLSFPLEQAVGYQEVRRHGDPVIVDDLWGDSPLAKARREGPAAPQYAITAYARSFMAVPLMIKERVIGEVAIEHSAPHVFTPQQAKFALTIANQAAVAIENARLYAQAQQMAAVEERARLARELHDSVTQMLFSASVIAEVLPRLWERDQDDGRQHLGDLRLLTRGALAEMRTLLLELRPAALTEAELGELLRQLAEAMTGRTRVPVALTVDGQRSYPPDVQIALYRIAQEGLHNAAKHAGASAVVLSLRAGPRRVELHIGDDGRGFDPAIVAPEHFGLRIMQERADAIGATLAVDSAPGRGTRVVVQWTDPTTSEGL